MAKRKHGKAPQRKHERRLVVRGVRREPADLRKLGRALIQIAQTEAEREAKKQHAAHQTDQQSSEERPQPNAEGGDADGLEEQ
ncbi:hypothetical protein [Actinomadura spongiicola]|uniref:hypothetical protein n=1 Tax=Actinomadura spongiicola TaxID=2303421 RepID=UPI0011C0D13F|nr:hypothetical protein [Actinomadura spongiicola]